MSQQPSQAFSTPPEPARHADGDVITGLREGTVVLLSLVCTNPRYPSRPVAAMEGRVRIRPRGKAGRLNRTSRLADDSCTCTAYLWSRHSLNKNQPNGMDKHV
ncbi:hypothetical protein GGI42DRAFT_348760 [Trichoderma sp. SZMC 28013]